MSEEETVRYMAAAMWFISAISHENPYEENLVTASVALSAALHKAQPEKGWTALVPPAIRRSW